MFLFRKKISYALLTKELDKSLIFQFVLGIFYHFKEDLDGGSGIHFLIKN